jgi:hypothetical protein
VTPPARLHAGGVGEARNRRLIAQKYLEAALLAATEEGPAANNVVAGICVLAGIAGGDAICLTAIGQRYAGQDHAEAARFLGKVDREAGKRLASLVRLKPIAHYGSGFVSDEDRTRALRAAEALVEDAVSRTTGG